MSCRVSVTALNYVEVCRRAVVSHHGRHCRERVQASDLVSWQDPSRPSTAAFPLCTLLILATHSSRSGYQTSVFSPISVLSRVSRDHPSCPRSNQTSHIRRFTTANYVYGCELPSSITGISVLQTSIAADI